MATKRLSRRSESNSPFGWRPYLAGAVIVCVLISTLTGFVVWQDSVRHRERAEVFTHNAAILLVAHIDDVFIRGDALLQEVAYHYNDQIRRGSFDPQRFNAYLTSELAWSRDYRNIRMLDADGILRYGTGEITSIDLSDRQFFLRLRDNRATASGGEMVISEPTLSRLTHTWILGLARRMEHPDGTFAGVVYATLDADDFSVLFSTIDTGPRGAIILRTDDMAQVARYPRIGAPGSGIGNRKVSQELIDMVKRSPPGGSYRALTPIDGIERYYTFKKVDQYPFYVIVGQATNNFIENWDLNIYLLLAFSGLMILTTVVGSWRVYGLTQQRIRERVDKTAGKILEASPVAMLLINDHGVVTNANPAANRQFGYTGEGLVGVSVDRLQPVRSADTENQRVKAGQKEGVLTSEGLYERKDGSRFTALRSVSELPDEMGQGTHYLETLVDISELKEAQANLRHLAHYDTLTNLPNRSLFFDLVDQGMALARREKSQLAILFLDLDKFKPINDTWGHAVGDLVLQEAARRIAACLRESDTVGRVGGDEFLALLLNLNSVEDAIRVGEKIREALNQPFMVEDKRLTISSCIGIALYPDHGATAVELTEHADTAMYQAKEAGRDQVVVYGSDFPRQSG